jgi:hypothetical protein
MLASNWPIVPIMMDGGMRIGKEYRNTRKKTYPSATLSTTNAT